MAKLETFRQKLLQKLSLENELSNKSLFNGDEQCSCLGRSRETPKWTIADLLKFNELAVERNSVCARNFFVRPLNFQDYRDNEARCELGPLRLGEKIASVMYRRINRSEQGFQIQLVLSHHVPVARKQNLSKPTKEKIPHYSQTLLAIVRFRFFLF